MASRDTYERTFDENEEQTDQNTCPECSDRMTANAHETASQPESFGRTPTETVCIGQQVANSLYRRIQRIEAVIIKWQPR